MNELHFTYKVRQHLNRGLHDLRPETLDRLAAARQAALVRQKQTVAQSMLAAVGNVFSFGFDDLRLKQVMAAVALLLCALYSTYQIADQRVDELGAIDSALLSDDLPIAAFTDKGFAAWLKSTSSQ